MPTPVTLPAEPPPARAAAWERTYPGTLDQPRQLRADLRPVLDGCPAASDVLLVASELAANAIVHSDSGRPGGTFTVRLHHGPGHIRAEVQDEGSLWDGDLTVWVRNPHGLYLIAALAAGYGSAAGPGRSRLVWARIDYPPRPDRAPEDSGPSPAPTRTDPDPR
jgi:serine/threonine-protein kinase RsbW